MKLNDLIENQDLADLSADDLTQALNSLIERGIIEKVEADGGPRYRLTKFGVAVKKHSDSDPKERN